jgi:transposase
MEAWSEIRRKVLVEKVSKRQICRDYQISHHTLAKMLEFVEPPAFQRSGPRARPKLDPFLGVINGILASDLVAPVKQRHTAKRIFERLRDEHGYDGCESQVRAVVAVGNLRNREVFVPLRQPPGEAQFDFGEAVAWIAGEKVKVHLAVMGLPYSDAVFVSAYARECTESFQQAHVSAFNFFGGVPTKIAYDNTTVAVKKVLFGARRDLTNEFLRLESHYLFTHRFCRVARGNEKGHVENLVGYHRRNFLVPVPSFDSFRELNDYLEERCTSELARTLRGHELTKAERLEVDRAAMLSFPKSHFEARRITHVKSNSLSLVRFDRNDYSVPTAYAHSDLVVVGGIDTVRITSQGTMVASHRRSWAKEQIFFDPLHYLALLERKPGAFDAAKPLANWKLPDCFSLLRKRFEAEMGYGATKEFIKVLRLLERFSLGDLTAAITRAIEIGTTSVEAIALICQHHLEEPVELFGLDGHPHLRGIVIELPDLTCYRDLQEIGA